MAISPSATITRVPSVLPDQDRRLDRLYKYDTHIYLRSTHSMQELVMDVITSGCADGYELARIDGVDHARCAPER
jgi:hypothetical protein